MTFGDQHHEDCAGLNVWKAISCPPRFRGGECFPVSSFALEVVNVLVKQDFDGRAIEIEMVLFEILQSQ